MTWKAEHPEHHLGKVVDSGHCVAYVRLAAGAPHTSQWRKGERVSFKTEPGTVIATFDPDGTYGNHVDGRSHAAILISVEPSGGLVVFDQWKGQPVHQRVIRAKHGLGQKVNDADAYHVVETA
jgi:hypothetical protein